ncbi:winged helix-turn-helix domain-containing protein [Psychrosphaera sp.]|nr:winged helix-turn-helix domain-containing protein [Psychrosphaera sp.]
MLRPKTFDLLVLLSSNPQKLHSKADILDSIWDGSVVEDQVVFQSINEIRKEFASAEVIKTYPKRGYKWETPIKFIDGVVEKTLIRNPMSPKEHKTVILYTVLFLSFSASLFAYFFVNDNRFNAQTFKPSSSASSEKATDNHQGILVLPFNVSSLNESQRWLRYGAMEGLIKRISPENSVTVFHLEDVIEILNRVDIGERDHIDKIFAKSGASYILETSLSGQPGELNVVHTIYSRTTKVTRTFQAASLEHLLTLLGDIFAESTGEDFSFENGVFNQQLQNDLIAKAIQFFEVGDLVSALSFINSAVINEPKNIVARFFLVKIYLQLGNFNEAINAINETLAIDDKKILGQYFHRLEYFKGSALMALGRFDVAKSHLVAAENLAKQNKDWLYYAYSQSMLGKYNIVQNEYSNAYQFFEAALEYQELLNCPMGIVQGHLDISDLHLREGDALAARQRFKTAKKMAKTKNLNQVLPLLAEMEQRLGGVSL